MITVLAMVFVFGMIVFIHEFGHFIVAKWMGVRVERFSLGFGPKLLSVKRGYTEYMICALPLGGYVKMAGDEVENVQSRQPWEFLAKNPWSRNLIVLAGPVMNLVLAFVLFAGIFMVGVPAFTTKVGEVKQGYPAQAAGIQPQDTIVAIDGIETPLWNDLVGIVYGSPEKELRLRVQRAETGKEDIVYVTPRVEVVTDVFGKENKIGLIGITPTAEIISERLSPPHAIWQGLVTTGEMTWMTYKGLWMLVTRQIPGDSIGGPIMIAKLAGETAKRGILQLLHFTCIISITLGVINLLPVPVLDGGHLMFFTIEGLRGKALSLRTQEISQRVGLALLLGLMIFATYNDIMRFFT